MPQAGYFKDIAPSEDIQEFTSFGGADIPVVGRHVEVIDAGAGTKQLAVVMANGQTRTVTVYDKWQRAMKITAIKGGGLTTAARVQVSE